MTATMIINDNDTRKYKSKRARNDEDETSACNDKNDYDFWWKHIWRKATSTTTIMTTLFIMLMMTTMKMKSTMMIMLMQHDEKWGR